MSAVRNRLSVGSLTACSLFVSLCAVGEVTAETLPPLEAKVSGALLVNVDAPRGAYLEDGLDDLEQSVRDASLEFEFGRDDHWAFVTELSMGRGDDRPSVDDMFFEAKMDGGIEIAAGQFKPSFGLDNSNSGKSSWFNERSMAADVFAPDRGIGFAISETKGDLVGSVALSNAENDEEDGARNIRSLSGRVVQAFDLPGKKHYLHIGGSLAEQLYNGGEHRLRTDAELDISGSLIRSPNNIAAVDAITYGFEAAYVYQQWAAQAEYLAQSVNAHLEDDFTLDGYYIALSWFLTKDEHEFKDGGLEKLKPDGDYGALELVARHSCVDLRVGTRGDAGCVQTLGINYYFDKDLRVNLQRIDLKRDDGEPDGSAWTLRGQYRF